MGNDEAAAHIAHMEAVLKLSVQQEWRSEVAVRLIQLAAAAAFVLEAPLEDAVVSVPPSGTSA